MPIYFLCGHLLAVARNLAMVEWNRRHYKLPDLKDGDYRNNHYYSTQTPAATIITTPRDSAIRYHAAIRHDIYTTQHNKYVY